MREYNSLHLKLIPSKNSTVECGKAFFYRFLLWYTTYMYTRPSTMYRNVFKYLRSSAALNSLYDWPLAQCVHIFCKLCCAELLKIHDHRLGDECWWMGFYKPRKFSKAAADVYLIECHRCKQESCRWLDGWKRDFRCGEGGRWDGAEEKLKLCPFYTLRKGARI